MTDDPFETPEAREWAQRVRTELVPKLRESALTVSLVPRGDSDVKFAVELGMSIMLDKPIIAVVAPGAKVPDKLVQVADLIVEGDVTDPGFGGRIQAAVSKILARGEEAAS